MAKYERIAVREAKAADMLDMPVKDFRRLVAQGALPGPQHIGDLARWWVEELEAIRSGKAARPAEDEFSM